MCIDSEAELQNSALDGIKNFNICFIDRVRDAYFSLQDDNGNQMETNFYGLQNALFYFKTVVNKIYRLVSTYQIFIHNYTFIMPMRVANPEPLINIA